LIASLAGAIAIVTHGNRYLRGHAPDPPDMTQNSAFKFVKSVRFYPKGEREKRWWQRLPGVQPQTEIAPIEGSSCWLQAVREQGAKRLWLGGSVMTRQDLPAHIAVAFAGTTNWAITAETYGHNTMWVNTERLLRQVNYEDPNDDKKIWESSFYEVEPRSLKNNLDVESARDALDKALNSAIAFCGRVHSGWSDWLGGAQLQLSSADPKPKYFLDMFPPDGMPLRTRQLGYAASGAWVFGGMGSWNDQLFEKELSQEFDLVTGSCTTLYRMV
jgi:hypothetical protein